MNGQIRKDAGGSLHYDPTESERPTSATYILYKPDGSTVVSASSSATIDPVNTTLDSEASEDDKTLTLVSAAGVEAGRTYYLTAPSGQAESVRVVSANATTGVVTLAEGVAFEYSEESTFVGNRVTMAVSSANSATLDEGYEARLSYVIDGTTCVVSVYYDVVRQPWPSVILTPSVFKKYVGSLSAVELELVSREGLDFIDEIEDATDLLRLDIIGRGMRPDLFRTFDEFQRVVALRVLLEWAYNGTNVPRAWRDDPASWVEQCRDRYDSTLSQALGTIRTYDENDDAEVTETEKTKALGSIIISR